jgi:hypothetical protein
MQNQPHLIDLGLARLELLKTFTIASLEQQTSQNYLWVIRTDPKLNATLKQPLLEVLQNQSSQHYLLIASNENPNIQIRELRNSLEHHNSRLWSSGDLEWVSRYLDNEESSNHNNGNVFLETRLDADDALHANFVETVQVNAAAAGLFVSSDGDEQQPSWKIWCASQHLEWQYHSVWDNGNDAEEHYGALFSLKDQGCISTGLTIGYTDGIGHSDLPPIKHDQLGQTVRSCGDDESNNNCLDFVKVVPAALRARTPTSAGMLNILFKKQKGKANRQYEKGALKQKGLQAPLWDLAGSKFGYTKAKAVPLHQYLQANVHSIAVDNLKGQCTTGHSCKKSSNYLLQTIIDHPDFI